MKLKSQFALKSGQRHELLILQFTSFDDAREIKSVWLALYLLIANFSCDFNGLMLTSAPS